MHTHMHMHLDLTLYLCWHGALHCRIYRPEKPEGERFKVTNAKTRLARLYHATSILTAKGDIIIVSVLCTGLL
jgi:hypothetical protein